MYRGSQEPHELKLKETRRKNKVKTIRFSRFLCYLSSLHFVLFWNLENSLVFIFFLMISRSFIGLPKHNILCRGEKNQLWQSLVHWALSIPCSSFDSINWFSPHRWTNYRNQREPRVEKRERNVGKLWPIERKETKKRSQGHSFPFFPLAIPFPSPSSSQPNDCLPGWDERKERKRR